MLPLPLMLQVEIATIQLLQLFQQERQVNNIGGTISIADGVLDFTPSL